MEITNLLQLTIDKKASDLHIISGYAPALRINNDLFYLNNLGILEPKATEQMIYALLSPEHKENLLANKEIDFGYEYKNNRFRINVYYAQNKICASFRLIPSIIGNFEELHLPSILKKFITYQQGLILLTGPTGEGKSTTLAAMINEINATKPKHIVTIEDPIEFIYPQSKSLISQRELHSDTHSMTIALRSVLREDPDIVLVGEMRDYDTIQAVMTIAETGHLVLSTLHTKSTSETISRIIDVFPAHQQNQIRSQLASVLVAVVAQRLLPTNEGQTRYPAFEILVNTTPVASLIRSGKDFMIDNIITTNEENGMILFEKYLSNLYHKNIITKETAISYAFRENDVNKFIK